MDNPLNFVDPLGLWGLNPIQSIRWIEPIVTISVGVGVAAGPLDIPLFAAAGLVTAAYNVGELIGEGINAVCRAPQ